MFYSFLEIILAIMGNKLPEKKGGRPKQCAEQDRTCSVLSEAKRIVK